MHLEVDAVLHHAAKGKVNGQRTNDKTTRKLSPNMKSMNDATPCFGHVCVMCSGSAGDALTEDRANVSPNNTKGERRQLLK